MQFVTGAEVGKNLPAAKLLTDFDAVVICAGATVPRDLRIPGRDLAGIHFAMDYLHANTKSLLDSNHQDGKFIDARGKRVVVIGGGDTGTDCVGTAVRHGASRVVQLEILPRPPDERAADNPWPEWPKVYKLDYGQEEAKALWGDDPRQYAVMTKRFAGEKKVEGLQLVGIEWLRAQGGKPVGPRELQGTERTLPADLVLLALGFTGPERGLPAELGLKLDERGNIATDEEKMTSVPGIFAAGDCARGQSLVVWAIQEGRRAARGVDKYLMYGETVLP